MKRFLTPPLISHTARARLRLWHERARELIHQQRLSGLYKEADERIQHQEIGIDEHDSLLGGAKDELVNAVTCCESGVPARIVEVTRKVWNETYFYARRFTYSLVDSDAKHIEQMDKLYTPFIDSHQARWMRGSRVCTICYMIFICMVEWPYHWILNHELDGTSGSTTQVVGTAALLPTLKHHMFVVHAFIGPTLCLFALFTFVAENVGAEGGNANTTPGMFGDDRSKRTTLLSTKCNRIIAACFSIAMLLQVLYIAEHNNTSGGVLDDSFVMFFVVWNFHITITQVRRCCQVLIATLRLLPPPFTCCAHSSSRSPCLLALDLSYTRLTMNNIDMFLQKTKQLGMRILIAFLALGGYAVKMQIVRGNLSSNFIGLTAFAVVSIVPMVISRHYSQYTFVQAELLQNQAEQLAKIAEKSLRLLRSVLPAAVASDPRLGKALIADQFEQATVLFTDLKGFTQFSAELTPRQLVDFLNLLYSAFDEILDEYGVYKVRPPTVSVSLFLHPSLRTMTVVRLALTLVVHFSLSLSLSLDPAPLCVCLLSVSDLPAG